MSFTWECPLTRTGKRSAHSTCAKEFAKEHGFQLIETSDDGNCFFYTLTKFGKRAAYPPFLLDSNDHRNAMALRQLVVNHIQENFHEYGHFLFNSNEGSVNEQVEDLRRNGAWASEAGDLVPIAAANAFGIHINLYNIEDRGDHDVIRLVAIRSSLPSNVFVSIMRVREGHFQLLWPRSGQVQSASSGQPSSATHMVRNQSLSNQPLSNQPQERKIVAAARTAVQAAEVAVSLAKQLVPASASLSQNEQVLNQISRNLNQLSLGSSPSRPSPPPPPSPPRLSPPISSTRSKSKKRGVTRRKKNNNSPSSFYVNNNNNLQRAMEESMYYQ